MLRLSIETLKQIGLDVYVGNLPHHFHAGKGFEVLSNLSHPFEFACLTPASMHTTL